MQIKEFYIIALLLLFFIGSSLTEAAEWGYRGLLPRGIGYYDKSSIKKIRENVRQVWAVTVYNEKGKEDAFAILKRQNKAPDSPEILNQESTLLEFDCTNGQYRIVAFNIYDEGDNLVLSAPEIDSAWHDIIPESVNEKLKKIVCSLDETSNHGYEPQGKPWTLTPQQAAGYDTLRCARLFD